MMTVYIMAGHKVMSLAEDTMNKMASDLGIMQFKGETDLQFRCRVVYSGMACWIKAVAMDRPVGGTEAGFQGVSRRHIYDRCSRVLDSFLIMCPELESWFDLSSGDEHPIVKIRSRLLNHGDLLNEGFDTNVALAASNSKPISQELELVWGEILQLGLHYSGIATVRYQKTATVFSPIKGILGWFEKYVKDAWWDPGLPDLEGMQYYNPHIKSRNNYELWQDVTVDGMDSIVLARYPINKAGYEYYLINFIDQSRHRIDPFLIDLGGHIRFMLALRSIACNSPAARVRRYVDHIELMLNFHLPRSETNLLESYAWPVRHINDKLNWVMPDAVWEYFKPYIEALEIQIAEERV